MNLIQNKSLQSQTESLTVCSEDPWFVVVAKPSGRATHPGRGVVGLSALELVESWGQAKFYPLHRLDAATSGVLAFGRSREAAQEGAGLFRSQSILSDEEPQEGLLKKTYWALVRGHIEGNGCIDSPVGLPPKRAVTRWEALERFEVPWPTGRYSSARYTLLKLYAITGRTHQLRLHMHSWSHPIIGDTRYGDGVHNRLFREKLESHRLMLHCGEVRGIHPFTKAPFCWQVPFEQTFQVTLEMLIKNGPSEQNPLLKN